MVADDLDVYYAKDKWTPSRIKSFLRAVPQDKLILLDYYCDHTEIWKRQKDITDSLTSGVTWVISEVIRCWQVIWMIRTKNSSGIGRRWTERIRFGCHTRSF